MPTTTTMAFPLLELPSELFLHILTRLRLKYLMRLRCVSKFFHDLINNPKFITSYHLHCKSNPNPNFITSYRRRHRHRHRKSNPDFNFMDTTITPTTLVASSSNEWQWQWQWPWRFSVSFKGSNYIYSKKHHELIPFLCPSDKLLISSMNGLVCFGGCYSLEIYNILAGTHYNLMSPFFTPTTPLDPIFVSGNDPLSNDYKILRIESPHSWGIYSFRRNSWKRMNLDLDYGTLFVNSEKAHSVCINGIIYWPPLRRECAHYDEIVLFDLHKEKFSEIQLPEEDVLLPTQYAYIRLLSFRGCLAFAFIQRTSSEATPKTETKSRKKKIDRPISYYEDIVKEPFKRKRGGVISEEEEKAIKNYGDMKRKSISEGGGEGEGEGEKASSHCGDILVELFILKNNNGGVVDEADDNEKKYLWNRECFVVPIPLPLKEVEVVSCCDEIFLGWFESNQLRLYNLHTKCLFNFPLSSSPLQYYPKVSFVGEKENDPTYVDNLSFDFSLN